MSCYTYVMKLGESRYTSTIPSALEGHQWLTCSCHINSGKEPWCHCIKSWVGLESFSSFWRREKFLSLRGFKPWAIQPVEQTLFWPSYMAPEISTHNRPWGPSSGCFTSWKETLYPLYRRLVGQEGQSDRRTKSTAHTGIQSPGRAAHNGSLHPRHEGI